LEDTIGGFFVKDGRVGEATRHTRRIVITQIVGDHEPAPSPRVLALRNNVMRKQALTWSQGMGMPIRILQVSVPSGKVNWIKLSPTNKEEKETQWLLNAFAKAMKHKVYVPTNQAKKCKRCWFQHCCSNYFALPTPSAQKVSEAREVMDHTAREYDRACSDRKLFRSDT
jgi:hypothetical protein